MADGDCIRIWTRDTAPEWAAAILARFDSTLSNGEVIEAAAAIAHVPQGVLDDRIFQLLRRGAGSDLDERLAWLAPEAPYLFGANAVDVLDDPGDDGVLVVFSYV